MIEKKIATASFKIAMFCYMLFNVAMNQSLQLECDHFSFYHLREGGFVFRFSFWEDPDFFFNSTGSVLRNIFTRE